MQQGFQPAGYQGYNSPQGYGQGIQGYEANIEFKDLLVHSCCAGCCACCYPIFFRPLTKFYFQLGLTITFITFMLLLFNTFTSTYDLFVIILDFFRGFRYPVTIYFQYIVYYIIFIIVVIVYAIGLFKYRSHFATFQNQLKRQPFPV